MSHYIKNLMKDILPRRIKRLIYLSSILGVIEHVQQDPDLELIEKLNNVLKLAENANSYRLPIYVKSLIWKNMEQERGVLLNEQYIPVSDIKISDRMSYVDKTKLAEFFSFRTPEWLKYGSEQLMENDVVNLIDNLIAVKH